MRVFALPLVILAFQGSVEPLPGPLRAQLTGRYWHAGCPVGLSQLRLLTVTHWGFDNRLHTGQLVVNEAAAASLLTVFRRLHALRFPIRHMQLSDAYGDGAQPSDTTGAFHCRRVARSPCPGTRRSSTWSQHAYGLAVDLNPIENPYVGCGRTRQRSSVPFLDRSRHRRGMVTPAVVRAFRAVGWGWGGDWTRNKDYMHFSATGR
jgi:hypothetical protein